MEKPQTENRQPRIAFTAYLRFTIYYLRHLIGRREIRNGRSEAVIEPALQVGDLVLPQPLAILNNEERHWQAASVSHFNGVGSIIDTR